MNELIGNTPMIKINYKIDGIECYHSTFSSEQIERLLQICKDKCLHISGGSDYHGNNKPGINIGTGFNNLHISSDIIDSWLK